MSQIYLYGVISLSDICFEYGLYLLLSCQNVCQCKIYHENKMPRNFYSVTLS